MAKRFDTTPEKRFKILGLLVVELAKNNPERLTPLLDKLEEVSIAMDEGHPKALEALAYYEDNVLAILSTGNTVSELN